MFSEKTVDWIAGGASACPNKVATIELPSNRSRTYAEMHERISRIAGWLQQDCQVKRGDRVAVLALNSIDTLDIIIATWRIGAVHLALNFRLTASELDYIIGDAQPSVLIYDKELAAVQSQLSVTVAHNIALDGQGAADDPFWQTVADASAPLVVQALPQEKDEYAMLMYSSGTTGRPKGVIITHRMLEDSMRNFAISASSGCDMVSLTVMPLFHIGGLHVFALPALFFNATAIVMRSFDPGLTLKAISDSTLGITHFLGVPAIYAALRDHPLNAESNFDNLQVALAGAEAVPVSLVTWWHERGLLVQEGFGMTENVASCCLLAKEDVLDNLGSCGKAPRYVQVKTVREDDSECRPGELGELWCRGTVVTPGYWNNPEATAKAITPDGWLRTGDIAMIDANGFVTIADRVKDMYISGGENVYPAEVENVIYERPEIAEVAIIGVSDEQWGEVGCAVIALKPNQSIDLATLVTHCEQHLARFKLPRQIEIVDALPRNATGKVLKYQLRQRYDLKSQTKVTS